MQVIGVDNEAVGLFRNLQLRQKTAVDRIDDRILMILPILFRNLLGFRSVILIDDAYRRLRQLQGSANVKMHVSAK